MHRNSLAIIAGIICVSTVSSFASSAPSPVAQGSSAVHHVLADNDEPLLTAG
jgi:hypothetical protein